MTTVAAPVKRKYVKSGTYAQGNHEKMHGENGAPVVMMKNDPMKKDLGDLQISTDIQLKMIKNAEKAIANNNVLLAEIEPAWKEKLDYLNSVKGDFKEVDDKKNELIKDNEDQEAIIKGFRNFLGIKTPKVINGQTIATEKLIKRTRKKEITKRVDWLEAFRHTLDTADKFMTFEQMWGRLMDDKEWTMECGKPVKRLWELRKAVMNNMIQHADQFGKNRQIKNGRAQVLVIFKEKFGLADWMDPKAGTLLHARHLQSVR